MDYSKTSNNTLVFDPFEIRPGTPCELFVTYMVEHEVTWNSDIDFNMAFPGLVVSNSVKSDEDIALSDIVVTESNDEYTVDIRAQYKADINLKIYYYKQVTQNVISKSAFNSLDSTYYKDYVMKNGRVVPKAVLEVQNISDSYQITDIDVRVPESKNNGIAYFQDLLMEMDNSGLLKYNEDYTYILRVGEEEVKVPMDSDLEVIRVEDNQKVVKIDNQEWKSGYSEARGILVYDDNIMVLTNKSVCVFNIYGNYQTPSVEDENVIGYDLTYLPDDSILVSNGSKLYKYHIRHNNVWIDQVDKRVYFREVDPRVEVTG